MKQLLIASLLLLCACQSRTPEQKKIMEFMERSANDPSSYEAISFRFVGPATYGNLGIVGC